MACGDRGRQPIEERKLDDFLGQNMSGIQKTVDEMIKAALDDQLSELSREGTEALKREEQRMATLEKERDDALKRAAHAEKEAAEAKDTLKKKVDVMKKQFHNTLATKEARIASLESRFANINSLLRENLPVAQSLAPKSES